VHARTSRYAWRVACDSALGPPGPCCPAIALAAFVLVAGCGTDAPAPAASYWLVGSAGTLLEVTPDGVAPAPTPDATADLLGVATRADGRAWIVGTAGTLLGSTDAGASWSPLRTGTSETLRAVAASDATAVIVVGDASTVLVSIDSGDTFAPVSTTPHDWVSTAINAAGDLALLGALDGTMARIDIPTDGTAPDFGSVTEEWSDTGEAMNGVTFSASGDRGVAVGDAGIVYARDARGVWRELVSTDLDLRAVRMSADGTRAVTVGAAGAAERLDVTAYTAAAARGVSPTDELLGVHLGDAGQGAAVGANGVLLETSDFGATWEPRPTGSTARLAGVAPRFAL